MAAKQLNVGVALLMKMHFIHFRISLYFCYFYGHEKCQMPKALLANTLEMWQNMYLIFILQCMTQGSVTGRGNYSGSGTRINF